MTFQLVEQDNVLEGLVLGIPKRPLILQVIFNHVIVNFLIDMKIPTVPID